MNIIQKTLNRIPGPLLLVFAFSCIILVRYLVVPFLIDASDEVVRSDLTPLLVVPIEWVLFLSVAVLVGLTFVGALVAPAALVFWVLSPLNAYKFYKTDAEYVDRPVKGLLAKKDEAP